VSVEREADGPSDLGAERGLLAICQSTNVYNETLGPGELSQDRDYESWEENGFLTIASQQTIFGYSD
jgi:hypothetical protein